MTSVFLPQIIYNSLTIFLVQRLYDKKGLSKMYCALVIEDDEKIAQIIKVYLTNSGFNVISAHDGNDGLELFKNNPIDVVILDLMLPGLDGWEVCQRLRAVSDVPIMMLTALGEIDERVNGLDMGADDYLTKPFTFLEFITRVKLIIRRADKYRTNGAASNIIRTGKLLIDPQKHIVKKGDQVINLTITEFKILTLLASEPEHVFPRGKIAEYIVGLNLAGYERTLDSHIKNLRKKLEDDPACPSSIVTVHGIGYKLSGDENA